METLSYLIQNYNQVIRQDLKSKQTKQKDSTTLHINNQKKPNKSPVQKNNANFMINRKFSPKTKQNKTKLSPSAIDSIQQKDLHSPIGIKKSIFQDSQKKAIEKQPINLKTMKKEIEHLQIRYKIFQATYTETLHQINKEISKNKKQQQSKDQQFKNIKKDIQDTKKEFKYLISLVSTKSNLKKKISNSIITKDEKVVRPKQRYTTHSPSNKVLSIIGR